MHRLWGGVLVCVVEVGRKRCGLEGGGGGELEGKIKSKRENKLLLRQPTSARSTQSPLLTSGSVARNARSMEEPRPTNRI